jgi:chromosome segregation ATPase
MSWKDVLAGVGGLARRINTFEVTTQHHAEQIKKLETDLAAARQDIATLSTRIAVLEEARKTTAAEVKLALTQTLAEWEIQRAKQEAKEAKDALKRERALPSAEDV